MKKLMIAAAIVCAAAMSQASSFSWATGFEDGVTTPGVSSHGLSGATAYIFASSTTGSGATYTQSDMLTAFAAGTLSFDSALASGTTDSWGEFTGTAFNYGADENNNKFYFAIVADDGAGNNMLYISSEQVAAGQQGKTTDMTFSEWSNSIAAAREASGGYQGAGWYTAVPEPTSGLLLLLGMAGLALRRRRA